MQVTLLRHATAQPFGTTDNDFSRELIEKGLEQCKRVAGFCQRNQIKPDTLLSSPYPRAYQTATELVNLLPDYPKPQTVDWLIPGSGNQSILAGLNALSELESVMLVLHEPDISALLGKLLKTDEASFDIKKASLTQLILLPSQQAVLNWTLPCCKMY